MKIVCLKYGEALYPERQLFADRQGDGTVPLSFCFYLIETEDKKILIDTGCELCEHFKMYVYKKPVDLLREYGLTPEDITDVIITHSHDDHIGCLSEYKHATVYIQKDEYEARKAYFAPEQQLHLFEEECKLSSNVRIERIGGHTKGSCVVFAGKYLLCGDDAYQYRNLSERVRVGNTYSKKVSQEFVEKYSKSEWTPLLFHDSSTMPKTVGFEEII